MIPLIIFHTILSGDENDIVMILTQLKPTSALEAKHLLWDKHSFNCTGSVVCPCLDGLWSDHALWCVQTTIILHRPMIVFCVAYWVTRTNICNMQSCCERLALADIDRCEVWMHHYLSFLNHDRTNHNTKPMEHWYMAKVAWSSYYCMTLSLHWQMQASIALGYSRI